MSRLLSGGPAGGKQEMKASGCFYEASEGMKVCLFLLLRHSFYSLLIISQQNSARTLRFDALKQEAAKRSFCLIKVTS